MKEFIVQTKKIIDRERVLGYTDAAVFGGFGTFVSKLENKVPIEQGDARGKELLQDLQVLGNKYSRQSLQERKNTLREISLALNELNALPLSNNHSKTAPKPVSNPPNNNLSDSVQYLKNVGPQRGKLFSKMGIKTIEDLLEYYPKRYEDRRLIKKNNQIQINQVETVRGFVKDIEEFKPRHNLSILKAWIEDETGLVPAVWFNQKYVKNQLKRGTEVIVHGKVEQKYFQPHIKVQDYEIVEKSDAMAISGVVPVYGATEGLSQKVIRKSVFNAVQEFLLSIKEFLPPALLTKYNLMDRASALKKIHFPTTMEEQKIARYRLAFEELFLLQLGILKNNLKEKNIGISHLKKENMFDDFQKALDFELTTAQKRVIKEIYDDMESSESMARLIQGDVGSGKTVVAAAALYKSFLTGCQGAMMAPTEILAEQHYQSLAKLFQGLGVRVALLTGNTSRKDREKIVHDLCSGEIHVLVGTHALIQEGLNFHRLSLAITDEQHRFGVKQRAILQEKGLNPDVLVMTATPIPRTLALTLYGDLNLSVIDEMPPGRKEIKTYAVNYHMEERVLSFMKEEIKKGRQAYIVCPLIDVSEKMDLQAATELAERLAYEEFRGFNVGLLHGKMKPKEKDEIMERFRTGNLHILVSTTVIEVGINVPNVTVMLVRDAERFGLAQLHQLRGRIGRGKYQSYCILMHNAKSKEGQERMKIMETTADGFKIAEADLTLRGPGEFFGTRQHGLPEMKIANLLQDAHILELARKEALEILRNDSNLATLQNEQLRNIVLEKFKVLN